MARPRQRYRGVRQRLWGSWVSEIRAYDEAARLVCGSRARTNFPCNNASTGESQPLPTKFLSATLAAKLQRCHVASLQMAPKNRAKEQREPPGNGIGKEGEMGTAGLPVSRVGSEGLKPINNIPEVRRRDFSENRVQGCIVATGTDNAQQFQPLEDDHIQQMIEELLDYDGSVKLCWVGSN
ncbi:hypothetical protein U1Q18_027058 [Sarracenia purpurea var. burkii]